MLEQCVGKYQVGDTISVLWNADTGRQPQLWRRAKVLKKEVNQVMFDFSIWYWCSIEPSPEYWPARHYWINEDNVKPATP